MERYIRFLLTVLIIAPCHAVPFFLPRVNTGGLMVAVNRSGPPTHRADQTIRDGLIQDTERQVSNPSTKDSADAAPYCPPTCQCYATPILLTVTKCKQDPVDHLDPLLQRHINVTTLSIQNSRLSRLPSLFCNMSRLIIVDLTNNTLRDLPWDCIGSLLSLKSLNVPYNHIGKLVQSPFYLPNLTHLGFQHNNISEIETSVFAETDRMPSIMSIDLSYNLLKTIDSWPLKFSTDKEETPKIHLRDNEISIFTNYAGWKMDCTHKRPSAYLDLKHNNITHIVHLTDALHLKTEIDLLCLFEKSKIDLRHNPFICDCLDFDFYRSLRLVPTIAHDELFCAKPENLYRRSILSVPLDEFICHVKDDCPDHCECIDTPNQMNLSVICSKSGEELPKRLPNLPKYHYTYYVNFMDSNLATVEYRPYLSRIKKAFFSGNKIKNISALALMSLVQAETIYFDHNQLKYLPKRISMVNLSSSVIDLHLAENDWMCDCQAIETRAWMIREKERISDRAEILCAAPTRLFGFNLLKLSEDRLICGTPPNKVLSAALISVGATLGVFLLVFVLSALILSTRKIWLYRTFKWHPFDKDECEGENKEFDIFISYFSENEVYVKGIVIPGLEKRGYRIAFHRIAFLDSQPIRVSIEDCIKKSKRTLFIFSKDFIQNDLCMWEFSVALELDQKQASHRLLSIKYEDVNVRSMDSTLQAYFKKYPYVERDSPKFWENLQYGLPVNKLAAVGEKAYDVQLQQEDTSTTDDPQYDEDTARPNDDTVRLLS